MPEKVPDTPENMEICKRFCGPCPTFKPNELMSFRPHALFCARGKSEKPADQIENKRARVVIVLPAMSLKTMDW